MERERALSRPQEQTDHWSLLRHTSSSYVFRIQLDIFLLSTPKSPKTTFLLVLLMKQKLLSRISAVCVRDLMCFHAKANHRIKRQSEGKGKVVPVLN
jgi:hypothetical protein